LNVRSTNVYCAEDENILRKVYLKVKMAFFGFENERKRVTTLSGIGLNGIE